MNITVQIPTKAKDGFTLYAEGDLISKEYIKDEKPLLIFSSKSILILYYTYPHHRRLYIVSTEGKEKTILPQVNTPVSIIFKGRGKKYDLIKTALYYLNRKTADKYLFFPKSFYYELAILAENKTLNNSKVWLLMKKFGLL